VNKKRYFISVIFLIMALSPIVQKLTDPTLYGESWGEIGFTRLWTEYVIIAYLILIAILLKVRIPKNNVSLLLVIWAISTLITSFYSSGISRSLLLYPVVFIYPMLCYWIIYHIYKADILHTKSIVANQLMLGIIGYTLVGLVLFIYTGGVADLVNGDYSVVRTRMGILLGNAPIQAFSLFYVFLWLTCRGSNLRVFMLTLLLTSFVIGSSRTGTVSFLISILFIFYYSRYNQINILLRMRGITVSILFLSFAIIYYGQDVLSYLEYLQARFTGAEGYRGIDEDLRFLIWSTSFNLVSENTLLGIGIGNFRYYNIEGFSDSHNLFLSMLVETGVINFFIFIYLLYVVIRTKTTSLEMKYLRVGFVLFIMSSMTGSQMYIASGFVSPFIGVCFYTFIALYRPNQTISKVYAK
jgi:O-antigen ligase